MNARMLREAAKKGELPFDESLIDHPESCLISLKGDIYKVGEFLEFIPDENSSNSLKGIYQIEELDHEDKELILHNIIGDSRWNERVKVDKVANISKKVSYSESELAIKRLLAGNIKYHELPTCGVTKEQFLDNLDTLSLEVAWGALMQKPSGEYVFINASYQIEPDLRYIWPEPDNVDFRKKALSLWLHEERAGSYNYSSDLMRQLFGNDYATLALEYGNKASPAELTTIISNAWDNLSEQLKFRGGYQFKLQSGDVKWLANVLIDPAQHAFSDAGYDNKADLKKAVNEFATAKADELKKLAEDAKKAAEEEAQAKLRESQNYKEVPADIDAKFKELGMTICYNTQDTRLKMKGGTKAVAAFSRIFVQDTAGYSGLLYKAKEGIKDLFKAEYTKSWNERFGSWWHVSADVDLERLYQAIAG